ncbi:alginate export family protein [Flavobacterium undicola]|uniref:alginate export family protein n=1 Tax=Flavobacterium undicola TaxID=1932779 RepID=UPI00137905E2|nr:alginate export family protein [Flavobacterium undicola]MBA0884868.1 alginate export family protein [Flavobacterium undicola]
MELIKAKALFFQGIQKVNVTKVNFSKSIFLGIALTVFGYNESQAQLTATGQLRERTEVRDGQGTLSKDGQKAGLFNSQRTRLNIGYAGYRFKTFVSLQDVRVFGQDASSINQVTVDANDGIMLNEAWLDLSLKDTINKAQNISLKIGRQEIAYDDQKVLGGLDWLQQGRRHDAIVFKYSNKGWIFDAGLAFNQNKMQNVGTVYNGSNTAGTAPATTTTYAAGTNGIGTMYKSFQYAYLGKKFFFGDVSFLFFKDDFNQYSTIAGVKTYGEGVWSRNTTGLYFNVMPTRKINLTGSAYYQGGHDKDANSISSKMASITATYQAGRKLFIGPGIDFLSGNNGTKAATQNNRFDPLYGTPHKFWGYMDYFYAANGFGNQGLLNYFFKAKYNAKDNLTFLLDVHGFEAGNKLSDGAGGTLSKYLGTEFDLTVKYNVTKIINVEAGYCIMKATNSMASAAVKNVTTPNLSPQFAYLMLNIKPDFLAKK